MGHGTIEIGEISRDGTTAMTIDASGRVLQPAKPCFFAYMSSGTFAPGTGNSTKTPLNSTLVNQGSCWHTTNHLFTAPVAGVYSISWGVTFGADADEGRYMASRIYKNGSQIGDYHRNRPTTAQGGNQYSGVDCNIVLSFTASETFWVILQPAADITVAPDMGTYMCGFLIG